MFARPDDIRIELGVQVMRNCTINSLHLFTLEERLVIRGRVLQRGDILSEPVESAFIRVARCRQNGSSIGLGEMAPTCGSAGKFPAHQPQSNESKSNFSSHKVSQRSIQLKEHV